MKTFLAVLAGAVLLIASSGADAVQYRIVDLGLGCARDINKSGQVVGNNAAGAFLWQNGQSVNLGALGGTSAGTYSTAYAINNAGSVVGCSSTDSNGQRAFLWKNSTMIDIGALNNISGTSCAYDINNDDQIVGESNYTWSETFQHGFLWQGGSMAAIGSIGGYGVCAYAINDNGWIAGLTTTGYGTPAAFLRTTDPAILLNNPQGHFSEAFGINDIGQVVGYFDGHAFLWDNNAMASISAINANGVEAESCAYAVNNNSQVVGYFKNAARSSRAFVWQNGGMADLGTLGGTQSLAYGINDSGLIVGCAYDANNQQHAVLWEPVPEPSTILVLLSGLASAGIIFRRRA